MEKDNNISWEKISNYFEKDINISKMEVFGVLYNFLYKECGTGKALYVEPILKEMPEILIVLDKYFELTISVDKETKKVIHLLKSDKIKNPKECSKAKEEDGKARIN